MPRSSLQAILNIFEHNLPFESAAHAGPLFSRLFPDSEIAKKYGWAATKSAIVNYVPAFKIVA